MIEFIECNATYAIDLLSKMGDPKVTAFNTLIVGRSVWQTRRMAELCVIRGPEGTRLINSARLVKWPREHRTRIEELGSRSIMGYRYSIVWCHDVDESELAQWMEFMAGLVPLVGQPLILRTAEI